MQRKEEGMIVATGGFSLLQQHQSKNTEVTIIFLADSSLWSSLKTLKYFTCNLPQKTFESIRGMRKNFHMNYREVKVKSVTAMKRNSGWTQRPAFPPSQQCKELPGFLEGLYLFSFFFFFSLSFKLPSSCQAFIP